MIGKYPAKMDDKNRLFVPAKLREELGSVFYVTLGFNGGHKCLCTGLLYDPIEIKHRRHDIADDNQ
mgnify:CR=1 FL=1